MHFIDSWSAHDQRETKLYHDDLGKGPPVVLIHGWPLSAASWEPQMLHLPEHGLRVVAYDRRGFGRSSKPWAGYDYDTLADELKAVLDALDLQDVTLVGFSMGGGEVARYMSRHRGARVAKVAFVSAITPYLRKSEQNPSGVDGAIFDQMFERIEIDRFDFLSSHVRQFFGVGLFHKPVSEAMLQWAQNIAEQASPKATVDCLRAYSETDFRDDLRAIKVPALVIHGAGDAHVTPEASAERTAALIPGSTLKIYEGAPHGLTVTHGRRFNADLAEFVLG